jgi:hypothetical protein
MYGMFVKRSFIVKYLHWPVSGLCIMHDKWWASRNLAMLVGVTYFGEFNLLSMLDDELVVAICRPLYQAVCAWIGR